MSTLAVVQGEVDRLHAAGRLKVFGDEVGPGSTDFWGISFAPSPLDREPFDAPLFERKVRLLRAAWAEFDETAARVAALADH